MSHLSHYHNLPLPLRLLSRVCDFFRRYMMTSLFPRILVACFVVFNFIAAILSAATGASAADPRSSAERLAWFREAKCGLFIHWSLFSKLAGSYHGERIDKGVGNGLGEWIMYNAKIPVAEYASYARDFNPVKFDAEAWVRLAKDAGMKYIVFTAKHCDGFAMFKSEASSYNIVDATPFGRDPLKELSAACEKFGIRLGFYYAQAMDWYHPGGASYSGKGEGGDPAAGHWDKAQDGSFDEYIDRVAIPQVRELLTNYGRVSILWWDSPIGMTPERASRLAALLKLQPQIITNNRLLDSTKFNAYSGDTETPEQFIPATGLKGRLFEVCMTMNDTWGFKAQDNNWKSSTDIIRKLIDISSKGGNFLLNIGPDGEGEIPMPSVQRLHDLGTWLRVYHEAIYATTASLFSRLPWGRSTTKGNVIYLHVFDWPADGLLVVPGLRSPVLRASLLDLQQPLMTSTNGANLLVRLPEQAPNAVASVIKLEFAGPPIVEQTLPTQDADGVVQLPATLAAVINAYSANARLLGSGATAQIGGWDQENTVLDWEFLVRQPGTFMLEADAAVLAPDSVNLTIGKTKATMRLPATSNLDDYHRIKLGSFRIERAGDQHLELESIGKDWREVRLRGIRLVPIP